MTRQSCMLFATVAAAVAAAPVAVARPLQATVAHVTVSEAKASEFSFTLSTKSVPHGTVSFKVTNVSKSGLAHDFKICSSPTTTTSKTALPHACTGKGTAALGQNLSATLTVTLKKPGNYEYLCTVAGHAAGGMKGILKVT
jgi:uncharacterized cupredoxin-like copper-binding protein